MPTRPADAPRAEPRAEPPAAPFGGSFLLEATGDRPVRTPEDADATQRALARTARRFAAERIAPNADRLERLDPALVRGLLREAGALGLLGGEIPEAQGGLGLDFATNLLLGEAMVASGSFTAAWSVHAGVGVLPLAWFGTEAQRARWLPALASGETVAAYALSEAGSGSDALAARTRAAPAAGGFVLDGAKQWITNAGIADLFTVFARIGGEHFSAFVVPRGAAGLSIGREERKLGLRGSSTCPVVLEGVAVPGDQLLGEAGKGHRIAFAALDAGRLKLAAGAVAGARQLVGLAARHARERRAFGRAIGSFGLVREKLARMAAATYAAEAMAHRTAGLVDGLVRASGAARGTPAHDAATVAAAEAFAPEASLCKVFASEALALVADEALQLHGGTGYVEDLPLERAWRDQRANRIVEGTNEINRLLVPGTLLRRALKGAFPFAELAEAAARATGAGGPPGEPAGPLGRERRLAALGKLCAGHALRVAVEALGPGLAERQEVLGALADVLLEAFALDSALSRALQAPGGPAGAPAEACVQLLALEAHERAHAAARRAVRAALPEPAACRAELEALARLREDGPADVVGPRERLAEAALEAGRYPIPREEER